MKKSIFITGGHITPAIAIIDTLTTRSDVQVVFIGRKYAMEQDKQASAEYELIAAKQIRFLPITTGRLQRSFTGQTIPSLLKIPVGFVQSFIYCLRERPKLVVSFGGYIALPVAYAAWILRIPVITHEQTLVAGLANKLIALVARRVCVTFQGIYRIANTSRTFRVLTATPIYH
jgi:UDP-N-acetylglucosamine--N-acetylmuramyl-(pentapeptide) pyrophosphoryl-undecaprenol N-acetylglucosamine transferase